MNVQREPADGSDRRVCVAAVRVTAVAAYRTAVYNEYYRRLGQEDQFSFLLGKRGGDTAAISLNRDRRTFTERERLILTLIRSHLATAYENAKAFTELRNTLATMERADAALGLGRVVVDRSGRVVSCTDVAARQFETYFGTRRDESLPDRVARWLTRLEALLAVEGDVPAPHELLVVEAADKRLVVRVVVDADRRLLLLQEERARLPIGPLIRHGLTLRETEVLRWIAAGKTNAETAMILDISAHTVRHHLESIYAKLGVETRAAALALALQLP